MSSIDINELKDQVPESGKGQFIIIMGAVGSGKSTFGSTTDKPLFIDLEGTASNIKGIKRVAFNEFAKTLEDVTAGFAKLINDFFESPKYNTLVLDGGLEFVDIFKAYALKSLGRKRMMDHTYGDTFLLMRETTEKFMKKYIGRGKNIILITHIDETTEVNSETDEEFIIKTPMLGDKKLKYKLPALANVVGLIEVDKDGNRTLNCVQNDKNILKNQFGITEKIPANWKELKSRIDKYLKK